MFCFNFVSWHMAILTEYCCIRENWLWSLMLSEEVVVMIGKMFNCSEESEWEWPFWTNLLPDFILRIHAEGGACRMFSVNKDWFIFVDKTCQITFWMFIVVAWSVIAVVIRNGFWRFYNSLLYVLLYAHACHFVTLWWCCFFRWQVTGGNERRNAESHLTEREELPYRLVCHLCFCRCIGVWGALVFSGWSCVH